MRDGDTSIQKEKYREREREREREFNVKGCEMPKT